MRKYIEQEAAALEGGSENSRTEPKMGVYVPIRDLMEAEKGTETIDLLEEVAKAEAKRRDKAIAGEICQVLARYGIHTEPGDILKRLEELDDRSNKRYRDGYLAGYRKALEDQERSEEGNG